MPKKQNKKLYIVRKYIWAKSAQEALKKESKRVPDDVWVDDEWKKNQNKSLESAVGFTIDNEDEPDRG